MGEGKTTCQNMAWLQTYIIRHWTSRLWEFSTTWWYLTNMSVHESPKSHWLCALITTLISYYIISRQVNPVVEVDKEKCNTRLKWNTINKFVFTWYVITYFSKLKNNTFLLSLGFFILFYISQKLILEGHRKYKSNFYLMFLSTFRNS